jgi:hypothetical protein
MLLVRELLGVWLFILVGVWVGVMWDEGCGEGSTMCCVMRECNVKEMLDVDVMLGVVLVVCVVRVLLLLKAAKRLLVWVCDHGVSVGAKGIVVVLFGGSVC